MSGEIRNSPDEVNAVHSRVMSVMSRLRRAALLVLTPLAVASPAHAGDFTVRLEMRETVGPVATNVCTATAETSAPGYVALQTSVNCRIDDESISAYLPGPKAVSANAARVGPTFLVCVSGAATFVNAAGDRVDVTAAEQCTVWDH